MGTKMIRAAIVAALCMAATVRAAAYTVVDYWTGAYNSNWNVMGTGTAANWRYGADNNGTANFPNGTGNIKHAVFHPDYIQNYSVNVPGNYSYKGNLAIGVGTEANPLVISATSASNGFSSNQSGMWFALGYPLSSYYPATDAVVKFSGGTYGPWQAGSYIGTSDGAHYGHLILDGQTIDTTLKFGKADANAFIMYSGRLTSTNANVVCNGNMRFAVANNATGIVDKVGGDWTFGSGTDTYGRLYLGHAPETHAEFYHRGGTLTVSSWICIGAFQNTDTSKPGTGYAYFELDGGTVSNKTNNILICDKQGEPGDRAVVRIKSGTLAANTDMTIGNAYSGFLYMDGGELDVSRGKIKIAGGGANEDCALVMSNGVVKAQTIEHGSGTAALATILLDGGTLQASQSGTLMPGDDNLTFNVGPRGGTIDTNGKAIEIEEPLVSTGASCGITVTGGGSLTASGAGDLAGAITIGDGTALRYFDQDGVVADYTLSSLSIGAGATIALDVDATGCDTFSAGTTNLAATAEKPVTVRLIVRSIPEAGRAFPIFAMAEADAANFNVTAETPVGAVLEVVKGWSNGYLTYAILARDYVWNDGANGGGWTDGAKWNVDGVASAWANNNNAVFADADDTATLDGDVSAVRLDFRAPATVNGAGDAVAAISTPEVRVAQGVSATIVAPISTTFQKTGAGTLTLGTNMTAQTTIAEGTLTLAGATFNWPSFAFVTGNPVTLRIGNGATLLSTGQFYVSETDGEDVTIHIDDGGTIEQQDNSAIYLGWGNGSSTQLCLNEGGTLIARNLYFHTGGTGTGEVVFNGGTFRANRTYTTFGGLMSEANSRLTVTVTEKGGTIDNGGYNAVLSKDLAGAGKMKFVGSGKTTIATSQSAPGLISCEEGEVFINEGLTIARPVTVGSNVTFTVKGTAQSTITSLSLEADSVLNIDTHTAGVTPMSVTTLNLPASGTVALKKNGGTFGRGLYPILTKAGVTAADVENLVPAVASGAAYAYHVKGDTLYLAVDADMEGNVWTGAAGDGLMSTPGNWWSGVAPTAGSAVNFSGATSAITVTADITPAPTFDAVTMGAGVVTFNGTLTATSFSDTSKVAVGANSTVTVAGNLVFDGSNGEYIANKINAGGLFVVTGKIETVNPASYLKPTVNPGPGMIVANEFVGNRTDWGFYFSTGWTSDNADNPQDWGVGPGGITGTYGYYLLGNARCAATIRPLDCDYAINAWTGIRDASPIGIVFDTTGWHDGEGHIVTANAGFAAEGKVTIKGNGTFVCNYVPTAIFERVAYNGTVTVTNTATLAVNAGKKPTEGTVKVCTGATLQVAQSGTVSLGSNLTLADGACLGFNYTSKDEPVLDLSGKTVTFAGGATTNVTVRISATDGKRAHKGDNVLTTGGKFAGATVTVADGAPDWVMSVSVDANGNIVMKAKPSGIMILIR